MQFKVWAMILIAALSLSGALWVPIHGAATQSQTVQWLTSDVQKKLLEQ